MLVLKALRITLENLLPESNGRKKFNELHSSFTVEQACIYVLCFWWF